MNKSTASEKLPRQNGKESCKEETAESPLFVDDQKNKGKEKHQELIFAVSRGNRGKLREIKREGINTE